jgi:single-stranded DNA-binding protein
MAPAPVNEPSVWWRATKIASRCPSRFRRTPVTAKVYGPQASLCAERLGKGSRVVVDGELDWREWTDQGQNRREAVVLKTRQILFERTGSSPHVESESGECDGSPDGASGIADVAASAPGPDDLRF